MDSKIKEYIKSKSTSQLSDILLERLIEYRSASMDPDLTLSLPNMDIMIEISKEISNRLKPFP